jgi:hypothetical protein
MMSPAKREKAAQLVPKIVPVAHVYALEDEDEQREPHGEHREEVMVSHGERELQTGHYQRVFQNLPPEHCNREHAMITHQYPARVPIASTKTTALISKFR